MKNLNTSKSQTCVEMQMLSCVLDWWNYIYNFIIKKSAGVDILFKIMETM